MLYEELKSDPSSHTTTKQDVSIDLQISASIPDEYFRSETDKMHFYREIESISDMKDIDALMTSFTEVNEDILQSTQNLFDILRLKIVSARYQILSIKKRGINYQLDFKEFITLDELKEFLKLDKEVVFQVIDVKKLRAPTKLFENDTKFLQYLLDMLGGQIKNPKIKLKRKNTC